MTYQVPAVNCPLCPRLVAYRDSLQVANPRWFNGAVPSFGSLDARFLVVGLAPGVRGRTERAGHSPAILPECCYTGR